MNSGFFIRADVADNHSANVNAFNILLDEFEGDKTYNITLPNPPSKYFCFFFSVHLLKIFVFTEQKEICISCFYIWDLNYFCFLLRGIYSLVWLTQSI